MAADGKSETAVEQIVGRLSLEPSVTGASWRSEAVPE